jgi:dTDP-4-dehydrorhamnose 3,5-epimerase
MEKAVAISHSQKALNARMSSSRAERLAHSAPRPTVGEFPSMVKSLALPKLIRTRRFGDDRGWFTESYNAARFAEAGIGEHFVQDNHSYSARKGTLRGLHFQADPHAQAKLVRCTAGAIWDVAVDIRVGSPSFGRWVGARLGAEGGEQLFIPVGFAHGFVTLTEDVQVQYKASGLYAPHAEGAVRWDDPQVAIDWPLDGLEPALSDKDAAAPSLADLTARFAYDGEPLGTLEELSL